MQRAYRFRCYQTVTQAKLLSNYLKSAENYSWLKKTSANAYTKIFRNQDTSFSNFFSKEQEILDLRERTQ